MSQEETYIDTQASVEEIGDYSHIPWVLNNLPRDTKVMRFCQKPLLKNFRLKMQ